MAAIDQTAAPTAPTAQPVVLGIAALLIGALVLHVGATESAQHAVTFLAGAVLGYALYRGRFGFTGPWRRMQASGRAAGWRRTLLMLGCASAVMIGAHALAGAPLLVHPVGAALLFGAFLFGVGMQLGGCCGSGTAWVAGGGSARGMVTLTFFVVGSVWGSVDAPFYWSWPQFGRVALVETAGPLAAVALTLAALGALWALSVWRERVLHGTAEPFAPPAGPADRTQRGPWPAWVGAVVLGVLAGLVGLVTGQPWGVTFGYTLYGVKTLTALGFDVSGWSGLLAGAPFWGADWARTAIAEPLWRNNAASMTIALFLGAALASGFEGRWRPTLRDIPAASLLAAVLGGLLMGYGARLSTGCNIGAMVNGIASGSLHGWAWMAAALLGSAIGVRLRPVFRVAD